jgi:hypothetical protein
MIKKLMRRPAALFSLFLSFVAGPQLAAMSVAAPDFTGLVGAAETIVRGEVTQIESRWVTNDAGYRLIKTFVTIRTEEIAKGDPAAEVTLVLFGGDVGDRHMDIAGMPTFKVGERAWFFIKGNGKTLCPLIAASHGSYRVVHDTLADQDVILRYNGDPLTATTNVNQPMEHSATAQDYRQALSANAFRAAVTNEVTRQFNAKEVMP